MNGFFEKIGVEYIETPLHNYAKDLSDNLISGLLPILTASLALYYVLKGYMVMTGRTQEPVMEILIHGFKVALIAFLALDTGNFVTYGIDFINDCESFLTSSLPGSPSSSWAAIDNMWITCFGFFRTWFDIICNLSWSEIGSIFINNLLSLVYLVACIFLTCCAFGVFLLTKVSLFLIVGFGPLFFSFLMFPITRSWFDGWLKQCLNYLMTLVLFAAFMTLITSITNTFFANVESKINGNSELSDLMIVGCGLTMIAIACATLVKSLPSIAGGLIGGMSLGTVGMGKMVGGIAKKAAAAGMLTSQILSAAQNGSSATGALGKALKAAFQSGDGAMARVSRGLSSCSNSSPQALSSGSSSQSLNSSSAPSSNFIY